MKWQRFWLILLLQIVRTYGGCEFKPNWAGRWFISGVQQLLTINSTWIESKGSCLENSNDKYEIYYAAEDCYRCMVIHEKHRNVLQYKETYCDKRDSLENLCNQIAGDATLYSMFRVEPKVDPVPCPFKTPPFTFTYSRGFGECGNPPSRVDSCTDDSRLSFKYQACPDVQGTESTVEELQCLAQWKDGSTQYLVGKLSHHRVSTDEDAYRCFVWERVVHDRKVTYNLAQSGDATCNGLTSASEGSRTIRLVKVENSHTRCKYPSWVTDHHRWHTLDHKESYHFSHKNATLKITEESAAGLQQRGVSNGETKLSEMRVVCHAEVLTTPNKSVVSAHVTNGCESGYVCLTFYKRDANVIELQRSRHMVQMPEEACNFNNFRSDQLPYTTLITTSLPSRKCPHPGRYNVLGHRLISKRQTSLNNKSVSLECDRDRFESVTIGCGTQEQDTMVFGSVCGTDFDKAYSCYGSWEENGTHYLIASPIARKSTEARRYCFVSRPVTEKTVSASNAYLSGTGNGPKYAPQMNPKADGRNLLTISYVANTCDRSYQPAVPETQTFNVSLSGQCSNSEADRGNNMAVPSFLVCVTLITLVYGSR